MDKIRKIILEQNQSPGDILALTAAVRDVAIAFPRIQIRPITTCPEIWFHNPYVHFFPKSEADETYYVNYSDIHNSGKSGRHFTEGFRLELEKLLDIQLPRIDLPEHLKNHPTYGTLYPDIYLSDEELNVNILEKKFGIRDPYWIINAGYKEDYPLKYWGYDNYKKVVADMLPYVRFVQVGESSPGHFHPRIPGVIDMVGKTRMRDFFQLCYHAAGSIGPVSMHMHVMGGLQKPCIVIAGGREPVRWEMYPNHVYLATNGLLSCCRANGCWKKYANPEQIPIKKRDMGEEKSICIDYNEEGPRCHRMITPSMVTDALMNYTDGVLADD